MTTVILYFFSLRRKVEDKTHKDNCVGDKPIGKDWKQLCYDVMNMRSIVTDILHRAYMRRYCCTECGYVRRNQSNFTLNSYDVVIVTYNVECVFGITARSNKTTSTR